MDVPNSPTGSQSSLPSGSSLSASDLSLKYNHLCSEYSKLRSQFGVLKKAVLEEQDKTLDREEVLREMERMERKRDAEMDSIKFRNQQLTKRIQVLQEEMEASELQQHQKKKKPKDKDKESREATADRQRSEQLNSVMGQELQSKIEENARLHAKLADIDHKYEDVIAAQNSRIRELESETKRIAQAGRADDTKQKDLIQGMKEEKVALLGHIRGLEREVVDAQDRITVLAVQLESAGEGGSGGAAAASAVVSPQHQPQKLRKASSNGSSSSSFPLSSKDVRIQSVELLSGFGETVSEMTAALSDLHTYWEHRLKDTHFDGPLTDNAARLSAMLLQNVRHLKPVEATFQEMLSKVLSRKSRERGPIVAYLVPFAEAFKSYVEYACGLEALTTSCLQHESNLPSCPPSQQSKNGQLGTSWRSYNRVMVRLSDYIKRLDGENTEEDVENLENITVVLSELLKCASDLNSIYTAKASDEVQLPTVTDQLKNTNMCIVNALGNLESSFGTLLRSLSDSLPRIKTLIQTGQELASQPSQEEEEEEKKANDEQNGGNVAQNGNKQDEESEFKYLEEEKKSLMATLADLQDKMKKAEQNREHWKLECQLLQMKVDKLKNSEGETDQDKLFSEREAEIRKPFDQRIEALVCEKMMADTKATSFYLECLALKRRMKHAEGVKSRLEGALSSSQDTASLLREESTAIASNYELQLSMMTEHVANMNEKLSAKSEQIEGLKYELKGKKGKK